MKLSIKLLSFLLLAVLVFIPMRSAAAKGLASGQVIFGQSYTLKSGQTLQGDLVVFGGSITIEEGAKVNGTTLLFGGLLQLDGEVTGDVAVVGGSAKLGPNSHIHGNLSTVGTTLDRADTARIDGQIFNSETAWTGSGNNGNLPIPPVVVPPINVLPNLRFAFDPLLSVWKTFSQAIVMALLAMLLMLFLAPQAERLTHAILVQPAVAGGLGLLTLVAVPVALITLAFLSILIVTIIVTVPLIIILAVVFGMAAFFGWVAIGYEIGRRFTKAIHQDWHPALAAGLGTFALTLVANGASILNFIPGMQCVTWIFPTLVVLFALGAVVMTRFGTQTVTAPSKTALALPPAAPSGPNPLQ